MVIVCSDGEQTKDCSNEDNNVDYRSFDDDRQKDYLKNCQDTAIAAATPLKDGGATVFSWGFGTSSMDTLTGIASGASRVHAYTCTADAHARAHAHALQMHMHCHFHPEPRTPNPHS